MPDSTQARAPRLESLDLLRGIIMVIMSLDHIRDYFTNFPVAPEDVQHTWPLLFFTRWITHFCAPLFFFLAGAGAYLSGVRGRSPANLRHFLWTRGLWLVALELSVIGIGWTFNLWGYGGVIWALGWSMVLMSLIVRLPLRWIALFGLLMIFGHNLLDGVHVQNASGWGWLWILVHQSGFIPILPQRDIFFTLYVLVPWVGVMAAGYAFGAIVQMDPARRRRIMLAIGAASVALFAVLRATNFYGQSSDRRVSFASLPVFTMQSTWVKTVIAFLDVQKYPPSLHYLLMTLGPGILALWLFDGFSATSYAFTRALVIIGRVPMFYYVLHIYLIHLVAYLVAAATGQPSAWLLYGGFMTQPAPAGYGHGLGVVYMVWIAVNTAIGALLSMPLVRGV